MAGVFSALCEHRQSNYQEPDTGKEKSRDVCPVGRGGKSSLMTRVLPVPVHLSTTRPIVICPLFGSTKGWTDGGLKPTQ